MTKSGSNNWHGSAYDYHRNTVTAANSWFNDNAGVEKPALIRNQFGGTIGGPVKKDKLFFFFNYNGRRDAFATSATPTVPLDSFRNGNINYIKAGCPATSKLTNNPDCIGTYTAAQVAALDPQGVGFNSALMGFIDSRYPHANDLTLGDGINTGGYRFNIPVHRTSNDYVGRVDYNMNSSMRLFGRVSVLRDHYADYVNYSPVLFPGDPLTKEIANTSYSYVIGHTWTIGPNKVNQFAYGETVSQLAFPTDWNPAGLTNWTFGLGSSPYLSQSQQSRKQPIPTFRDDFTWQRGNHNIQMGGTFKPIKTTNALLNDFNFATVGLGGLNASLNSTLRPADISTGTTASNTWDSALAFALGRFASVSSNYNYNSALNPLAQGTGFNLNYRYWETEAYIQDSWKATPSLTLTYGLRYQYYSVPYEVNGIEAMQNLGFDSYLFGRVAQGMNGVSGYGAAPIAYYDLAGKANNARGLYEPNLTNFAPRFAFAYSPSFKDGFLAKVLGDRKTVIRGGSGIVYDHPVTNALNFIQSQNSYMFQSSTSAQFGGATANDALLGDPRFTSIDSIPTPVAPPTIDRPYAPFVDAGIPVGTVDNEFNYAIDPKLKTPYSIALNFGVQRELPGHFVLEATYVGRLGRRLIAQADASQLVDFKDPKTGQMMSAAFANLTQQVANGATSKTVTPVPWFESQIGTGGTAFVVRNLGSLVQIGDVADTVQALQTYYYYYGAGYGIQPNIGMPAQFAGNTYITNKGSSNYNGLLMTLHKNVSQGLQFDLNYTLSHSIDNASGIANSISSSSGMGFICDAQNLRICRGNSDFDVKHMISGMFVYDLPFGKGKAFGSSASGALNQLIGGWNISGIPSWRSGLAYTTITGAYLMGYANNSPALFNGDYSALKVDVHKTASGQVAMFADPEAARAAFSNPAGFNIGNRNNLRGPRFWNLDMAVGKNFPITERVGLKFRAEAYNALNHPSFGLPGGGSNGSGANINSGNFGLIGGVSQAAREMQFSLKLEF